MIPSEDSACWTNKPLPGGGTLQIGYVESGGHRHRYYAAIPAGEPKGQILAIHGFGTTGERTWRHIAPQLAAAGIALYAPDLLGTGESDKPEVTYGLKFFAAQAAAFTSVLELNRPVLLGHSMGGKIAATTAVLYPDMFSGLILVNSGGFDRSARWLWRVAGSPAVVSLVQNDLFYRAVLPRTPFGPLFPSEDSREHFVRLRHSHRALDLDLTGIRARLLSVRMPVLVAWGERDHLMPRTTAGRIASCFPNASIRYIPGAGHAPMKDAPDALAAELVRFIAGIRR